MIRGTSSKVIEEGLEGEEEQRRRQQEKKMKEEIEQEGKKRWEDWEKDEEVGLIKGRRNIEKKTKKKKNFMSKLTSRFVGKREHKTKEEEELEEKLIKLELQRELRWQLHQIFPNAFDIQTTGDNTSFEQQQQQIERQTNSSMAELQEEVEGQVNQILGEGGMDHKAYEHAFQLLASLQIENVDRRSEDEQRHNLPDSMCGICQNPLTEAARFPEKFTAPILDLDEDYVKAFHRACINTWLNDGHREYGVSTKHVTLVPNLVILGLITSWTNRLCPSTLQPEASGIDKEEHAIFHKLVGNISSATVTKRNNGIATLCNLTKLSSSFRTLVGLNRESVVRELLWALGSDIVANDCRVQDDIISIVLNASQEGCNKESIGKDPFIIPLLIVALESSELAMNTKAKCATALLCLSDTYYNKIKIGELGAIKRLVQLLEQGHLEAQKAAVLVIVSLCMASENHRRALESNVVDMVASLMQLGIAVEESVMILWLLRGRQPMTAITSRETIRECMRVAVEDTDHVIWPESTELLCYAFTDTNQEYYQVCRKIIAVFRKTVGIAGRQREERLLRWLIDSTDIRNRRLSNIIN